MTSLKASLFIVGLLVLFFSLSTRTTWAQARLEKSRQKWKKTEDICLRPNPMLRFYCNVRLLDRIEKAADRRLIEITILRVMKYLKPQKISFLATIILFGFFLPRFTWAQSRQDDPQKANGAATQSHQFQPPYPFTTDELLNRLLRVLMLPEGHVTRRQAEDAFGIKIPEDKRVFAGPRQPGIHYLAMEGVDWYFPVGVIDGSLTETGSTFSFGLGRMGLHYPNVCISEKMTSAALSQGGWIFEKAPNIPQGTVGSFKSYTKGKLGKAVLYFASNGPVTCLEGILIASQ